MPYRGFKQKPPPVKMAWVVAILLALLVVAVVFGGTYLLVAGCLAVW